MVPLFRLRSLRSRRNESWTQRASRRFRENPQHKASVGGTWGVNGAGRRSSAILAAVGFNPYRRFKAKPFDYALVATCIVVAIALVLWAVAG